jgi:hypothetical protein
VLAQDEFISEMAFVAYRRVGDSAARDAELQATLSPDKHYLYDLEFLPASRP